MSEVSLLITGVLSTRQPILLFSPEQQQLHLDIVEQKSINKQTSKLIPTAQVTPPEFIRSNNTFAHQDSPIASQPQVILEKIPARKLFDPDNSLAISKTSQDILALYQNAGSQAMPTLHFGSSGISVRILQRLLAANGYGIQIDGVFGPLTETAVKAFQSQRHLPTDGVAGHKTWWELTTV
jgi:N-acetyl-anhydromuramyl-L-alanine amidase AmpD